MKALGCPVCGNPNVEVIDDKGCTTFEICDCCGAESGYTFDTNTTEERWTELRREWLYGRGGHWHSTISRAPNGWDPVAQMRSAGIEVPTPA
jgi:hypothetical protein